MKKFFRPLLASTFVLIALIRVALADVFMIPDTRVSFNAPTGFTVLTDEQIKQKYLSARAPTFVVGDADRGTTIAYDIKANRLPDAELEKAMASFVRVFDRIVPGIVWKKREIITVSGQRWVLLEMTSNAVDTDIYNIMLTTGYEEKMLIFNFNSTREAFPKMEAALRASISSIKLQ